MRALEALKRSLANALHRRDSAESTVKTRLDLRAQERVFVEFTSLEKWARDAVEEACAQGRRSVRLYPLLTRYTLRAYGKLRAVLELDGYGVSSRVETTDYGDGAAPAPVEELIIEVTW